MVRRVLQFDLIGVKRVGGNRRLPNLGRAPAESNHKYTEVARWKGRCLPAEDVWVNFRGWRKVTVRQIPELVLSLSQTHWVRDNPNLIAERCGEVERSQAGKDSENSAAPETLEGC